MSLKPGLQLWVYYYYCERWFTSCWTSAVSASARFGTVQPAALPSICTRLPNLDRVFPGKLPAPSIPTVQDRKKIDSNISPSKCTLLHFNTSLCLVRAAKAEKLKWCCKGVAVSLYFLFHLIVIFGTNREVESPSNLLPVLFPSYQSSCLMRH